MIIQLETAAGAAMKNFDRAIGVCACARVCVCVCEL